MWLGIFLLWLFRQANSDLKVRDLRIPKKRFVLLVLQWCSENLGTIKHPYQLKIYYYQNSKYSGRYIYSGKQIVIYLFDDLELIDLVDSICHEIFHHIQSQKTTTTEKDYNKELSQIGYWNNKYEVEARRMAEQYRKECLKWVLNQI